MPPIEKPKTYIVIDTEQLREYATEYPTEEEARSNISAGETLVQAICAIDAVVTEYRRRDVAPKGAAEEKPKELDNA